MYYLLNEAQYGCCRVKVTDYGLPSFLCGQGVQESEADQFKRKIKARTTSRTRVEVV